MSFGATERFRCSETDVYEQLSIFNTFLASNAVILKAGKKLTDIFKLKSIFI